jgi:hypothetical protein
MIRNLTSTQRASKYIRPFQRRFRQCSSLRNLPDIATHVVNSFAARDDPPR